MAYLKAQNGSLAGQRFELAEGESVLGRSPECSIHVEDFAVSRQHAKVHNNGGEFFIEDLKSRNKTYLNDVMLGEKMHQLRNGDRLSICDVIFNFYQEFPAGLSDSLDGSQISVLFDGAETNTATIMSKLEVGSGQGQVQLTASPDVKLSALLEITQALGNALSLGDVLPSVLDALFKVFMQADRAFIGLLDESGTLVPRWSKARREDTEETIRISRTIVNRVIELKEAILSADAASDQQFDASQSIADFKIRSMMCVPLFGFGGEVLGVLQVDTLERNKQFNDGDLEVLVSVATQAGIALDNARLHDDVLAQQAIQKDLELAQQVQLGFLPSSGPEIEHYTFFDYYRAANHIGGDYYDYLKLKNGTLAVIVADVVGHGVAAALLMSKVAAETRFCLATEPDAATAVSQLNDNLSRLGLDRFVTFLLAVLNPKTDELTVVNAGHMAPIHRRADGTIELVGEDLANIPLGIMEDIEYESFTFTLQPGDSITMYTDGLNEAANPAGALFTMEAIEELVRVHQEPAKQRGERILGAITTFMQGEQPNDDMCLVIFDRD